MLFVLCLVGTAAFGASALMGAKSWNRALQNGSEEDIVQAGKRLCIRSAGVVIVLGGALAFTAISSHPQTNIRPQSSAKPTTPKVSGGIS